MRQGGEKKKTNCPKMQPFSFKIMPSGKRTKPNPTKQKAHNKTKTNKHHPSTKICRILVHEAGLIICHLGGALTFLIPGAGCTFETVAVASLIHPHTLRPLSPEMCWVCCSSPGSFRVTYEEAYFFIASETSQLGGTA